MRILGLLLVWAGLAVLGFVPYALFATRSAAIHAQHVLVHVLAHPAAAPAESSPQRQPAQAEPGRLTGRPRIGWPASVPVGAALARLSIPAAGVRNDIVVQGADELRLQEGPGHYPSTPLPGEPGNIAIAGHRTTWLRPFANLQAVARGDMVSLRVGPLIYVYRTTSVFVVAPDNIRVIQPIKGWWLTLTTCTPRYSASHRLVVRAELARVETVNRIPVPAKPRAAPPAVVRVRVPKPIQVIHTTSWSIFAVWLVVSTAIVITADLLGRARTRFAWLLLLPAAACCFEAYGAAVRLIPSSF
jgi:sortase A